MVELKPVLRIQPVDNVAVALTELKAGEEIRLSQESITIAENIPSGHKVALTALAVGDRVIKYGYSIGIITSGVQPGQWVHTHNMSTGLSGKETYHYEPVENLTPVETFSEESLEYFDGYVRENGDVGIRNEIWIINTVGCVNKTAERLAQMANERLRGGNLDGVYHFAHPYGCSQLGDDLVYTQRLLAALAHHPNAAGVLILGLGCENNRIDLFGPFVADLPEQRIRYLAAQAVEDELETGLKLLEELAEYAQTFDRGRVPVSKLRIGLKCGGSDGFSGITANPLVGAVSDLLVANGGGSFLTEVPEMFGAETILMNRATDAKVFDNVVSLIDDFKDYYTRHNQVIYENPSPGNKDGGITTLEEKSLGCIQKGGLSPVSAVLQYAERSQGNGLQLIQAPGNDMVSVTALIAAGAHIVLFTTGRGTPLGGPVPTLKISTNQELATRKPNWIDFDAGALAAGANLHHLRNELYRQVLDVASGKTVTRNEKNGFREIAIFKDGVTL